jgi:hypothetical protein
MKIMKTLVVLGALPLVGCVFTPSQKIALAGAEAGNVYATYELSQAVLPATQAATVKALTDLATALPNIPLGKVSAFQLGALQGELQVAKANLITNPQAEDQIISLISLIANNQGSLSGGVVTAEQAEVFGAFQNVATGITNAVQVFLGRQSTNPGS